MFKEKKNALKYFGKYYLLSFFQVKKEISVVRITAARGYFSASTKMES